MSAELLINITPQESRVALLENGVLQEVMIERTSKRGIVGNIYKGKVSRVLPGMEAAFIDIGLEKAAFLHASDLGHPSLEEFLDSPVPPKPSVPIGELLYEGKKLLVQVIKDPLGTKGARLTTHITIPSRYLVLMPDTNNLGVSSKIDQTAERDRLRKAVENLRTEFNDSYGYIVRTAADGISEEELRQDMCFLRKLWQQIAKTASESPAPTQVYSDLPLVLRVLRDMVGEKIERVLIDSKETAQKVIEFSQLYIPDLANVIDYSGERPIFDLHGVEEEIQKALQRKVPLKSGGYLIIDQTEAMTTIDVNTGGFVGSRNLEETIFRTNLEAAQAIARQLRLRNLGGIIIIDFIDMLQHDHRQQVLKLLEKTLERDYAKTYVCDVSPLGLVEMTRKRTRESLEHILCQPCPSCHGNGFIKTAETVCYEVFREILRAVRQFDARELLVLASQEVVDLMLDEESDSLAELQQFVGIPIRLQVEALYTQEHFDVVLL